MTTTFKTESVAFQCEGFQLRGTLRRPVRASHQHLGVILLNQGPLDRSGAHQISTKIAKRLNDTLELPTLQFDARGVGESDGDWTTPEEGEPIHQLYDRIFNGAWNADTLAAISFFQHATGVDNVVLVGLCGGASTALHVAAMHPAVSGVAMVGMPVKHDAGEPGLAGRAEGFIREETNKYFQKLRSFDAWRRFLTFQTDYSTFRDLILTRVSGRFGERPEKSISSCINQSYRAAVSARRRMLFVYGENDYYWTEFRELFLPMFSAGDGTFRLETIPAANHTLTETSWQEQLLVSLTSWLTQQGAARAAGAA